MRLVMKFGGTSVESGKKIKHVAEIIKKFRENEIVVVVSALSGITDLLLKSAKSISEKGDIAGVGKLVKELRERHRKAVEEAIGEGEIADSVISEIEARLDELEKTLTGICYLGELTEKSLDYVASFGERLSAPILCGAIRKLDIDSTYLTGGEAGIITNEEWGNARPLEYVDRKICERIIPILERRTIPVVTGFIGETEKGVITTLGRGGSDYTATVIGSAIKADEIWLWKDTEGIMTADPKIIPDAKKIPNISYIEAMELSYFGAKVLHPQALEPAMENEIPVRVKNTFHPEEPGTLISKEPEKKKDVVKAITLIKDIALINVSGVGMIGTPGVAARVFSALAAENVNIIMISQGSSERTISIIIDGSHLKKAILVLENLDKDVIKETTYKSDVCAIGVVGAGMAGTPGVAGKIFTALGEKGINIIMISQGSSEYNISFVVRREDSHRAIEAIHHAFELGKEHHENLIIKSDI
ncbi:MAG: aspartate kinase [Candidatus Syntropharchaeia archaeon]